MSNESYKLSIDAMDNILNSMKDQYKIYAPKKFVQGGSPGKDYVIRYGEIDSINEVIHDEKSDFSPKEIIHPVMQTLLKFENNEVVESKLDDERGILIFARPCDVNGIDRLDTMFLQNGDHEDNYYKRLREKIKIIIMECGSGWDTCFCVSMGTNKTDDYDGAVKFEEGNVFINLNDNHNNIPSGDRGYTNIRTWFAGQPETDYEYSFVEENMKTVQIPQIPSRNLLKDIIELDYWNKFDDDCLSCGGCNAVCISCSCFDTLDIIFDETSLDGERRRKWGSCMLPEYSIMAGGHGVRNTVGERMRFKTLHKIYDFDLRFGEGNMCVGCGRCDQRCPQEIKFSQTIDGLAHEVEKLTNQKNESNEENKKKEVQ